MADKAYVAALTAFKENYKDRAIASLSKLPPFSPILNRLLASLADEDIWFSELAAIIEKDTVLASHVLKLVNSALYSHSGTVNSVRHAISIMGLNKLRNTALSLSVSRMWTRVKTPRSWSPAEFNKHSVATGVMADLLAQRVNVVYPEGAFTAGLLHAVGKLLIAIALPAEYERIVGRNGAADAPMEAVEFGILNFSHAELGAAALAQWKLPAPIEQAVARQHDPDPREGGCFSLSFLLRGAHQLVNVKNVLIPACGCATQTADEVFSGLGLDSNVAGSILDQFQTEYDALKSYF